MLVLDFFRVLEVWRLITHDHSLFGSLGSEPSMKLILGFDPVNSVVFFSTPARPLTHLGVFESELPRPWSRVGVLFTP